MNISWEERQISDDKATSSTHDLANSSHNLGPTPLTLFKQI